MIDEKKLRCHLSKKLPKYMIPNYFVHLEHMPMTASGKIGRKNLPMPNFTAHAAEFVAPTTEREKKLCQILEEMLPIEHVGIQFALQNVFDYPIVQSLCSFLENGNAEKYNTTSRISRNTRNYLKQTKSMKSLNPKRNPLGMCF